MDTTRLRNALFTRLRSHYRTESAANEVNDPDYWLRKFCEILSEEVIGEIVDNARCQGNDSDGDTHDNVGII